MTRYAFAERLSLLDRMAESGPTAPTLCGDWTVRDLAAHLLLRERRPDAAIGIVAGRFAARTAAVQGRIAARDFPAILRDLRTPPWWSPISNPLLDEAANLAEMYVHHEDVRRAVPGWAPRELPDGLADALWRQCRTRAGMGLRRHPARVVLRAPGRPDLTAGEGGPDPVTVTGAPGELLLFLLGRQAHATVALAGPAALTEQLRRARLGI